MQPVQTRCVILILSVFEYLASTDTLLNTDTPHSLHFSYSASAVTLIDTGSLHFEYLASVNK